MRFLEEFWYGNIEPAEYEITSDKAYRAALERMVRDEEKFLASLNEEQRTLYERHAESEHLFQAMAECMLFQNSFKMGARMMLEVMGE